MLPRYFAIQAGPYSDYYFYDATTGAIFARLNDGGEELFIDNYFENKLSDTLSELIMEFNFDKRYDFSLICNWKQQQLRVKSLESLLNSVNT